MNAIRAATDKARHFVPPDEDLGVDLTLPSDVALVERLEARAEGLFDELVAQKCPLARACWIDGSISMEWFGLKGCECQLTVYDHAYEFLLVKLLTDTLPSRHMSIKYDRHEDPHFIAEDIARVISKSTT